jgi:hypothetical protein
MVYAYRLPTEEEWTYAAGDIEGSTYGWCDASSTQRVGALMVHNGLYDTVGNVLEWTSTSEGSSSATWYCKDNVEVAAIRLIESKFSHGDEETCPTELYSNLKNNANSCLIEAARERGLGAPLTRTGL